MVIFAEFLDTIAEALTVLSEEASSLGFTINWAKTKIQSFSDSSLSPPISISIGTQDVEAVKEFVYLGCKLSSDSSAEAEIIRRLQLTRGAFGRMSPIWHSTKFKTKTKLHLLDSTVLPVRMYCIETWTLTAALARKVDTCHRTFLCAILGIHWYDFISNEQVYRWAGNPPPVSIIIKRKLQLLGHVAPLPEGVPARQILLAASRSPPPDWHRPHGRPRLTWVRQADQVRLPAPPDTPGSKPTGLQRVGHYGHLTVHGKSSQVQFGINLLKQLE